MFAGNIVLRYESSLDSVAAQGRVEYVLYALNEVIMYIIEAKNDDMAQGKAQLFLQLNAILRTRFCHIVDIFSYVVLSRACDEWPRTCWSATIEWDCNNWLCIFILIFLYFSTYLMMDIYGKYLSIMASEKMDLVSLLPTIS